MPALDGLRGLAILAVLVHHLQIIWPAGRLEAEILRFTDLGKHGVDLFFVLSGFLITGILLDSRSKPRYFRNFYARRTLRIFPLYYALLLFFFVIVPAVQARGELTLGHALAWSEEARHWPWYAGYLSNVLFVVQDAFGPSGLDVTWSLAIEEQFYLAWALLIFLIPPRRFLWLCLALVMAAPAIRIGLRLAGLSWTQVFLATPSRLDTLAAGAALAVVMRLPGYQPGRLVRAAGWVLALAASGIILLYPGGYLKGMFGSGVILGLTLMVLLCAGTLVMALHAPAGSPLARIFQSRFLGFFGRYSYAMYLFHMPIQDAIRRHFFPADLVRNWRGARLLGGEMVFLVATTLCVVAAALLSWHLFEKHFLALKRYFRPRPVETSAV